MKNDSPRVTRRGVQITLGLLWLLDGALKFQPAMLTSAFARQVIAPAGQGQPGFISWPVHEAASIIARAPAAADIIFGLIELALGAGLLHRRTARWALAASSGLGAGGLVPGRGPGRPVRRRGQPADRGTRIGAHVCRRGRDRVAAAGRQPIRPAPGPVGGRWPGPRPGSAGPCCSCSREVTPMRPSAWP